MEAIKAEIEAMKVANNERDLPREAAAYDEAEFFEKAEELRDLACRDKYRL